MNKEEILEYITKKHREGDYWGFENPKDVLITEIDREGGEGKGDYYHVVYKVTLPTQEQFFAKIVGYYNSWDGINWYYASAKEAKAVEKTITVYEEV
jgi:hypothetical protein